MTFELFAPSWWYRLPIEVDPRSGMELNHGAVTPQRAPVPKSGRGLPQSKTCRKHDGPRPARSVLECARPCAALAVV